jgi:hypothetical protein
LSAKKADGDEKGRYQFAGLAAGEYRILAVSPTTAEKLDEPRVWSDCSAARTGSL